MRPGQNKVLKILDKHGEMLQQDLLAKLGIRAPSLTELLKKLEADEYITRRRHRGGNSIMVTITEKGRISALECRLSEQERDQALFSCLTQDERTVLAGILNKLLCVWHDQDSETEGQRRERRWAENAAMQEAKREIEERLNRVAQEMTCDEQSGEQQVAFSAEEALGKQVIDN